MRSRPFSGSGSVVVASRVAAVLGVLLLVAQGGCGKRTPRDQEVEVTGTLIEATLDEPLRHFAFRAGAKDVTTDEDGRFRFRERSFDGRFLSSSTPLRYAVDLEPGAGYLDLLGPRGSVQVDLPRAVPESLLVDAGTLLIHDDETVDRAFGRLCSAPGGPAAAPAQAELLAFRSREQGEPLKHDYRLVRALATGGWKPRWKAALCIETLHEKTGEYNSPGGSAYKTTWRARLVRLTDGKSWRRTVSMDPPVVITVTDGQARDGYGDPTPKLVDWLDTVE